jgi:hypothetical protein
VLEGILDATLLSHVMWNSSGEVDLANDLDFEYTSLFHPATLRFNFMPCPAFKRCTTVQPYALSSLFHPATLHLNFMPCPAFKRCTTVQPYALSLFVCFYDYLFFSSLS